MGDRTFSSDDVLRIFRDHLDREEQERVRNFFAEPSEINLAILQRILELGLDIVAALTSPTIGFLISIFPDAVIALYNDGIAEVRSINRALSGAIGSIDA